MELTAQTHPRPSMKWHEGPLWANIAPSLRPKLVWVLAKVLRKAMHSVYGISDRRALGNTHRRLTVRSAAVGKDGVDLGSALVDSHRRKEAEN